MPIERVIHEYHVAMSHSIATNANFDLVFFAMEEAVCNSVVVYSTLHCLHFSGSGLFLLTLRGFSIL